MNGVTFLRIADSDCLVLHYPVEEVVCTPDLILDKAEPRPKAAKSKHAAHNDHNYSKKETLQKDLDKVRKRKHTGPKKVNLKLRDSPKGHIANLVDKKIGQELLLQGQKEEVTLEGQYVTFQGQEITSQAEEITLQGQEVHVVTLQGQKVHEVIIQGQVEPEVACQGQGEHEDNAKKLILEQRWKNTFSNWGRSIAPKSTHSVDDGFHEKMLDFKRKYAKTHPVREQGQKIKAHSSLLKSDNNSKQIELQNDNQDLNIKAKESPEKVNQTSEIGSHLLGIIRQIRSASKEGQSDANKAKNDPTNDLDISKQEKSNLNNDIVEEIQESKISRTFEKEVTLKGQVEHSSETTEIAENICKLCKQRIPDKDVQNEENIHKDENENEFPQVPVKRQKQEVKVSESYDENLAERTKRRRENKVPIYSHNGAYLLKQ